MGVMAYAEGERDQGIGKETIMQSEITTRQPDALPTEKDPRWHAVVARDASADGTFYYSVKTTGVYCLPSCAARLADPKNVRFHPTREDAERESFRPCKRCKPDQRDGTRPRTALEIRFAIRETSLGLILVAQSDRGVCAVLFGEDRDNLQRDLQTRFPGAQLTDGDADLDALAATVVGCVESPVQCLEVPLDLRGTSFQQAVWQALREIPAGRTMSYTEIARRIGQPQAVRAVAQACAANALAVVVPCHRVVKSDGSLSGYRWGVERKRALLQREAAA
jgi:AraC family transcriptional regulator of adaptative response/methylated-DNA-[protein]-cysteine methyltransferase